MRDSVLRDIIASVAICLLVVSVGAISTGAAPAENHTFSHFLEGHTVLVEGEHHLTHRFDKATLLEYLLCTDTYLARNPGSKVILNLEGHGWFDNNEVIAIAYPEEVVLMEHTIERLNPEFRTRNLKWLGIINKDGKWYDSICGASFPYWSPAFATFAQNRTIRVNGHHYLKRMFNKDILFNYLEMEVNNLAEISKANSPDAAVIVNLEGHGYFSDDEIIAKTAPTTIISDQFIYTVRELQNNPKNYNDKNIVWRGTNNQVVYIDMEKVNVLLLEIKEKPLKWLGIWSKKTSEYSDMLDGATYIPR
jgi:hypothetical protein